MEDVKFECAEAKHRTLRHGASGVGIHGGVAALSDGSLSGSVPNVSRSIVSRCGHRHTAGRSQRFIDSMHMRDASDARLKCAC